MARRKFTEKKGFRFPGTPPKDALDYFRAKDLRVGFSYRDVWGAEHAHAFTVAKMMQLDVLEDVRKAVGKALEQGQTFHQFQRDLKPKLVEAGWWGIEKRLDPKTGKEIRVQLGSPRRLRTIYRANLRASRAAGQWQRIQRTRSTHPFLLYQLGPSEHHRTQHVAWAGTILPADDPWWNDHFPPNGWGCKCRVIQLSRREAERRGGVTPRPKRNPVVWVDRRNQRRMTIDRGLDPAWARNSGRDRERILGDALAGRIDRADRALAQRAIRQVVDSALLDRQLAPRKKGDLRKGDLPLAWLDPALGKHLKAKTQVVRLTAHTAKIKPKTHPDITVDDYRRLPAKILRDARVYEEKGDLVFWYSASGRFEADNKIFKMVLSAPYPRLVRLSTLHRSSLKKMRKFERREGVTIVRR